MSSYPPPPDAPDVLPGEDGGDYASRKAEAAAIADAERLPEWVLLAEIARRRRHGRAAPDDAALAERLWRARAGGASELPEGTVLAHMPAEMRAAWLRVAAEARAALLPPPVLDAPERWTDDAGHVWPWRIGKAVRVGYRYACERCGKGWG